MQEEAQQEERAAGERMIQAQAEAVRAKQRASQLAAQTGVEAAELPWQDGEAQVCYWGSHSPRLTMVPYCTCLFAKSHVL